MGLGHRPCAAGSWLAQGLAALPCARGSSLHCARVRSQAGLDTGHLGHSVAWSQAGWVTGRLGQRPAWSPAGLVTGRLGHRPAWAQAGLVLGLHRQEQCAGNICSGLWLFQAQLGIGWCIALEPGCKPFWAQAVRSGQLVGCGRLRPSHAQQAAGWHRVLRPSNAQQPIGGSLLGWVTGRVQQAVGWHKGLRLSHAPKALPCVVLGLGHGLDLIDTGHLGHIAAWSQAGLVTGRLGHRPAWSQAGLGTGQLGHRPAWL